MERVKLEKGNRHNVRLIIFFVILSFLLTFTTKGKTQEIKKPYNIEIYTFQVGTSTYAFGVGQAKFINEQSKWLRAKAIEIPNTVITAKMLIEEPDKRTKIFGFIDTEDPRNGNPPFDAYKPPYKNIVMVAAFGTVFNGLVTLDPNIQRAADFSGKKVGLGIGPSMARVSLPREAILASGAQNVRFVEYDFMGGVRALKDGIIQGLLVAGFCIDPSTKKFVPNPAFSELLSTAKVYFVSFEDNSYNNIAKKFGRHLAESKLPPGSISPMQTKPWNVAADVIGWACDRTMPEDVVYEYVRIMAENVTKYGEFHPTGKGLTKKFMARINQPIEYVHPGALKYYKESGLDKEIEKKWIEE